MSAVIIYDTGSEVSLCNYETKPIVISAKKERKKIAISTINSVQNGLMHVCKTKLKNDHFLWGLLMHIYSRIRFKLKRRNKNHAFRKTAVLIEPDSK